MSSTTAVKLKSKPVVGVSECILGRKVRYNGEHKRHKFVTDVLSEHVIFEPVCPEVAIGLGVLCWTLSATACKKDQTVTCNSKFI